MAGAHEVLRSGGISPCNGGPDPDQRGWRDDGHHIRSADLGSESCTDQDLVMISGLNVGSLLVSLPPPPLPSSDLPINQLPDSHSDPAVQEGLGRIKELDSKLQVGGGMAGYGFLVAAGCDTRPEISGSTVSVIFCSRQSFFVCLFYLCLFSLHDADRGRMARQTRLFRRRRPSRLWWWHARPSLTSGPTRSGGGSTATRPAWRTRSSAWEGGTEGPGRVKLSTQTLP